MKESEAIKNYSDKLLDTTNKRFETLIISLGTKDIFKITLAKVIHALQVQEQRRLMREEGITDGAFQVKFHNSGGKTQEQRVG
ncbi:hypothetical protein CR513_38386, partial [Mucuna pruriens]